MWNECNWLCQLMSFIIVTMVTQPFVIHSSVFSINLTVNDLQEETGEYKFLKANALDDRKHRKTFQYRTNIILNKTKSTNFIHWLSCN